MIFTMNGEILECDHHEWDECGGNMGIIDKV